MKSKLFAILVFFAVTGQSASAGVILSLSSSTNFDALAPGSTATIDVVLSGLNPGDELDFLAATVSFDTGILGSPTISPGAIIPDDAGFLSFASPGIADANYDNLFVFLLPKITSNGIFFSFDVTPINYGRGTFTFDFVDSIGFDGSFNALPIVVAGPDVPFASVPEPTPFILFAGCLLAGLQRQDGRRHRRRTRANVSIDV